MINQKPCQFAHTCGNARYHGQPYQLGPYLINVSQPDVVLCIAVDDGFASLVKVVCFHINKVKYLSGKKICCLSSLYPAKLSAHFGRKKDNSQNRPPESLPVKGFKKLFR